jgi:hypothetical protein
MRRRGTIGQARRVADRRTTEPSPPDDPGEPLEWWHELIDEPARAADADAEPDEPDS